MIEAHEVTEGDFLIDLDNGYVFDVDHDENVYNVTITFHDSDGNENILIVGPDFPLNVEQGEPV